MPDTVDPRAPWTDHETAWSIADSAIALFLEYRDRHGQDEAQARRSAAQKVADGVSADLRDTDLAVSTCLLCGCTDDRACPGGCEWATKREAYGFDLCSACADLIKTALGLRCTCRMLQTVDGPELVEEDPGCVYHGTAVTT